MKQYQADKAAGVLREQPTMKKPERVHPKYDTRGERLDAFDINKGNRIAYNAHLASLTTIPLANPDEWEEGRIYNEDEVEIKTTWARNTDRNIPTKDDLEPQAYLKPEPKEDEQEKFLMDAYWLLEIANTEKRWIEKMKERYTLTPKK